MKEKRLISSYDEINDTFVGKVDGEHGFFKDYGISDGVYLGINNQHFPTTVFVPQISGKRAHKQDLRLFSFRPPNP